MSASTLADTGSALVQASPEIMLQACRGIAYILEAIPQSSADVVRYGSIAPLCSKLMAIQYIDVAEQALMTLHKISKDHASHSQLLQARGVSAVLSYLDFFPLSVQRTGMETVSNMCKRVSMDSLHLVVDSVPQLSQMLMHSDSKLVEHVCTAFCRLVTSLGGQKEALEQVAGNGHGVIANVWSLASNYLTDGASSGDKESSQPIAAFGVELCSQLLHMLAMLASASPKLGMEILAQPDVGQVLRSKILIEKPGESKATENRRRSSMELSSRSSPQLLREIMSLTASLLPALPLFPPKEPPKPDSTKDSKGKAGKASKKGRAATAVPPDHESATAGAGTPDRGEEGKAHWAKNEDILERFGEQLLEATLFMGSLSIDGALRMDALTALCKLIHYMPGDKVSTLLPRHQVCELMSALLASESLQLRFMALILTHNLMSKCGDIFSSLFTREGIVYALHKLHGAVVSPYREERDKVACAPPWAMRTSVPPKSGSNMQEATELVCLMMLEYVCERHLPSSCGASKDGDERVTAVVSELRKHGAALIKAGEVGNEEAARRSLTKIISYFEDSSKVSTFEMRCSGVCENLIRFLSPDGPAGKADASDKGKEAADKAPEKSARGRGRKGNKAETKAETKVSAVSSTQKPSEDVLRDRWDLFITLIKQKHDNGEEGVTTPAKALVHKLVAALNNTDGFGSSPAPQQGPEAEASWSKQSKLITLPLRLRFERCTSKDSHHLKDYSNPVVIDPLASISAIHDFLWPRVRRLPHEIPAAAPVVASAARSAGGRAEQSASASAPERPRRGAAAGKAAADDGADAPSGRPKRDTAKGGKGKGAAAGGAASSRASRDTGEADDVAALRGLVPPWAGSAGLGLGADDEMMSDGEADLADGMPMDDMVAATLLGGAVDEEGFDHAEMEDDMDLDHDGEDEAMHAQRAQVLDIQLSDEAGDSSPPLPSTASHGGSAARESSTRDRGGGSASRGSKGPSAAGGASSRGGGRSGSNAEADEGSNSSHHAGVGAAGAAAGREERGSAGCMLSSGAGPHLRLSIGGKVLDNHDMSIIEAVLMSLTATSGSSSKGASGAAGAAGPRAFSDPRAALWGSKERTTVHVIEYAPMAAKSDSSGCSDVQRCTSRMGLLKPHSTSIDEPVQARAGAILGASEGGVSLEDLDLPPTTAAMLRLVAVLQSIHADLPADDPCRVSAGELVVGNLSSKASCMIRDPLTVFMHQLPDWVRVLLTRFPFLVAHDIRLTFFDLEAFGLVRALKNAGRNRDGRSDRQHSLGHTQQRQKVRVGRQHILESAKHVMEIYTKNTEKAGWTLEVEFSGEVGVGKGPTQEFFTFFCR